MSNDNMVLSAVVLSYNQENYIEETIRAIIDQKTSYRYEIIICDDASTDKTPEILKELFHQHPELIKLEINSQNVGLMKNFQQAIKLSRGKYIAVCGGDDIWHHNGKIQKQVDFLENNVEYCVVYSNCNFYFEENDQLVEDYSDNWENPSGYIFDHLLTNNHIVASSTCFKSSIYKKYVDFDSFIEKKYIMEDIPTWLAVSKYCKFAYLPESLITYRVRKNSLHHFQDLHKKINFIRESHRVREFYIQKYGCDEQIKDEIYHNYHRTILDLGYRLNDKNQVLNSIEYLSGLNEALPFSVKLKMWGMGNNLQWFLSRMILKMDSTIRKYVK